MEHAVRIGFPFAWGFAFGLPVCSLAFQLLLCSGRSVLLRCCGSVPTLFLHFSSYFTLTSELPLCDCNAASTFVPGFQFLLSFTISVLTRLLRFGSYFAWAFQRSLRFCLSGPAQLGYLRSYSASTLGCLLCFGTSGMGLRKGPLFC